MLRNLLTFVVFQVIWTASVWGAGKGLPWLGPVSVLALLPITLLVVPDRKVEVRLWLLVGLLGTVIDSGIFALGWIDFPQLTEGWPRWYVPLWISGLWVAFAAMLRSCLVWLHGRLLWAALFGLAGGPFSFYTGTRFGAVSVSEPQWLGFGALALEWGLLTPLLLLWARGLMAESETASVLSQDSSSPDSGT